MDSNRFIRRERYDAESQRNSVFLRHGPPVDASIGRRPVPSVVRRTGAGLGVLAWTFAALAVVGPMRLHGAEPRPYPYKAVATVGMISDIVRQVAGDKAQVVGLIGTGVDPHLYKPTRNDIAYLQSASVIFYNGLMLEGKMADVLVKIARHGKPVYAVAEPESIGEANLLEPAEFQGHYDPHVWMDVQAWSKAVGAVAKALTEFDPPNEALYIANGQRYQGELVALHEYVKKSIATIPKKQRVLITAHDAFNYFGRAYDIDVRGIQGISTESEAGLEDINRLVTFIVENDVQAVFVETSVADKNVRALVEGAKSRGKEVKIGGSLFSDAMGAPDSYEGTYIGMIDHNATTIARALGGQAPPKGYQGRLRGTDGRE